MGHPFAPATYHNPQESATLHLFAPYQRVRTDYIVPVVVARDTYNLMWILLSPPKEGIPIQPGTMIQGHEPEDQGGDAVFSAAVAGPIDCDRRYIIFALFEGEGTRQRHSYDFAVPHTWSWISEEDQASFVTHRHERDDDFFPRVTTYLNSLLAEGVTIPQSEAWDR